MSKVKKIYLGLCFSYTAIVLIAFGHHKTVAQKLSDYLHYEKTSLKLITEKRVLEKKLSEMTFKYNQAIHENKVLKSQNRSEKQESLGSRSIASVNKKDPYDLVQYEVYQWSPEKLQAIGEKELFFKHYQKSAQFYHELITRFPKHQSITDRTLFGAGIASYESKEHYDWAIMHLSSLVGKYPKSQFYRGAKLWLALSHYQMGKKQKFLNTVEEFRKRYRNTNEWKILSKYYEDINYKIKN